MRQSHGSGNPGSRLSPFHTTGLLTGLPVFIILTLMAWQPQSAQAQESGYALGVDLPLQFVFTGDLGGSASTSGVKITLDTPYIFGLGYETYSVETTDTEKVISTTLEYTFFDIFLDAYFSFMHLALGYGFGSVTFEPFNLSGIEFSSEEVDSNQWFLAFGWPLTTDWEFHLGYHRVSAEADLIVNGVKTDTSFDLGGIMHSIGLKYIF